MSPPEISTNCDKSSGLSQAMVLLGNSSEVLWYSVKCLQFGRCSKRAAMNKWEPEKMLNKVESKWGQKGGDSSSGMLKSSIRWFIEKWLESKHNLQSSGISLGKRNWTTLSDYSHPNALSLSCLFLCVLLYLHFHSSACLFINNLILFAYILRCAWKMDTLKVGPFTSKYELTDILG